MLYSNSRACYLFCMPTDSFIIISYEEGEGAEEGKTDGGGGGGERKGEKEATAHQRTPPGGNRNCMLQKSCLMFLHSQSSLVK